MRRAAASILLAGLGLAAVGCTRNDPNQLESTTSTSSGATSGTPCPEATTGSGTSGATSSSGGATSTTGGGVTTGGGTSTGSGGPADAGVHTVLDDRVVDYGEALRTASFKLVGNAPSMDQLVALANATDKAAAYAGMVDTMMGSPAFAARMIAFWQNTMRLGGPAAGGKPSFDTAPTFAARIVVEGRPYTDLFTATTNNCPTYNATTGVFTDGTCANGPITAGILTNPGVHAQYYGNLAFRRHRFFQETFACRAQPAEYSSTPIPKGAGTYTSPWPFESIAGTDNGGRVDFHDTTSAICANCHTTANHRSPLFANFDENGMYQTSIQVHVPIAGTPVAVPTDWLPTGESFAWKVGVPVTDIGQLGAAMAADPEVQNCAVARMWNYAMSKGDIVIDAADVPTSVLQPYIDAFGPGGFNLKTTLRAMLVSDDFVRF